MDYLVDVLMPAYNQERFIENALIGIVTQKTNFKFRLLVAEDCSTDETRTIIEKYHKKYPEIIFPFYRDVNLGAFENSRLLFKEMQSTYIAICEGDDSWIDQFKLQKQVDFLLSNTQYILCFTRGIVFNTFLKKRSLSSELSCGIALNIENFISSNNQLTVTAVFKRHPNFLIPNWFTNSLFGDWALYLLLMYNYKADAYCLPDITSEYIIHDSGMHGNVHASNQKLINAYKMHLAFYEIIDRNLFHQSYKKEIKAAISDKISIITVLYMKDLKIIKAININISYLLKGTSWAIFFKNVIYIFKECIKKVIYK